ncbi:MAG: hypothetical protein KDD35_03860, partial [Bdellovibrionales bacterium]|nr:hypothetical protein [Bdellovibrionales bacterium]
MSIRFQEIYHKYAGLVFSVSNRIVLSPSVAEEIVQETFVRYFERAEGLDNDDPKYWLVKVATNLCFDELRRRTRSRLELFSTFSRLIPMFTTTIGTKVSNRLSSKLVLENMNPQER